MRLSVKINIYSIIGFSLIMFLFITAILYNENKRFHTSVDQTEVLLQALSDREIRHIANELFESRYDSLQIRLKNLVKIKGISGASVYDTQNNIIAAESSLRKVKTPIVIQNTVPGTRQIETLSIDDTRLLSYISTIYIIDDHIGYLQLLFSIEEVYDKSYFSILLTVFLTLTLFVTIVTIENSILLFVVLRPLNNVLQALIKTGSEGPGFQIKVTSNDEIGSLTHAFNTMSAEMAKEITKREKIEKNLVSSLKDKDVLFKEVHHRVKNNMQIISSLLRLQTMQSENETVTESLGAAMNRVYSMALIHENLYRSDSVSSIPIGPYIKDLVQHLVLGDKNMHVDTTVNIEDIILDINILIPIGLIINELVTNSIKHVFKNSDGGRIVLSAEKKNNVIELSYADSGQGYDMHKLDAPETLGLQLISSLSKQIKADISSSSRNGLFILTFSFEQLDMDGETR